MLTSLASHLPQDTGDAAKAVLQGRYDAYLRVEAKAKWKPDLLAVYGRRLDASRRLVVLEDTLERGGRLKTLSE